jgi:glycine cleavage system H lipoate-binding protein
LGDIVYVEVETNETSPRRVFGTVEAVKTVSDLFSVFFLLERSLNSMKKTGRRARILVNSDPYGDGSR